MSLSSFASHAMRYASVPFDRYAQWLNRSPLAAKSVTSGAMYGLGDVCAQVAEHYADNRDVPVAAREPFRLDWKRVGVFVVFGTVIAGPAFHAWFGYLDEVPLAFARLQNHRERQQILRSFAILKRHGFEVKMDVRRLPNVRPLNKWVERGAKIVLDQVVFSSAFLASFFLGVGLLQGGVDKLVAEARETRLHDAEALLVAAKRRAAEAKARGVTGQGPDYDDAAVASIDRVLGLLREEKAKAGPPLTWAAIWERTLAHAKAVYLPTFVADCVVWPPLQLINFTFVPLQYRVLYVNVMDILWNTFLSLQANKEGGAHE